MGRRLLVDRVLAGRPAAHVAAELGVSRATAYKWVRRFTAEGAAGLEDRSSRPCRQPSLTPMSVEAQVVELRTTRKLGPAGIGMILGMPASTVHRVLQRRGLNRLAWMDRPTGRVIRRYERQRPGELVHVDVKKLGRIPDGGGWRAHGRQRAGRRRDRGRGPGYEYVHSLVDDHSRLAYTEIHNNETGPTCAAFLDRALRRLADQGVRVERVLTDNALAYRGHHFAAVIDEHGLGHRRIRPYRPQTNGKVERFNRTLIDEWAYAQLFTTNAARRTALTDWLHDYNYHRNHTAIGGPPISRVNNVAGCNS